MRIVDGIAVRVETQAQDVRTVSLCAMTVGAEAFGIDTTKVREVLGECAVQRIPLAPAFIAGVIPNRGEVLTTVSLRALLGLEKREGASVVLVLEDEGKDERFGLMVDAVGGVVMVAAETLEENPSTLCARSKALFDGAYKLESGLIVRLDAAKLQPSRLKGCGLFRGRVKERQRS